MIFDTSTPLAKESWEGALPSETNDAYHARKGYLTSSQLKEMIDGPYNFQAMVLWDHERKSSDSFDLGSSVHEVLLTKDWSQFVVMPELKQIMEKKIVKGVEVERVKETIKAQKEAFEAENVGKRIITQDQFDRLNAMVGYIMSKRQAREILTNPNAQFEVSHLYLDPISGTPCQFRPDGMIVDDDTIIDYKTTTSVAPFEFKKACERYYYHVSAAHYSVGYERIYGRPVKRFILIAQESSYPYKVALYEFSLGTMKRAKEMRNDLIAKIRASQIGNYYPDYCDSGVRSLELAGYAFEIGEERI